MVPVTLRLAVRSLLYPVWVFRIQERASSPDSQQGGQESAFSLIARIDDNTYVDNRTGHDICDHLEKGIS